jgi:hypothetical protein
MHREHVVVGDHTVVIEHGVEHGNRRASSNEMIKAYLRTGRYAVNHPQINQRDFRERALYCP